MSLHALLGVAAPCADKEKSAPYAGAGTRDDPFVVDWDAGDAENPYNWPTARKAAITAQVRAVSCAEAASDGGHWQLAFGTWTVSFASSAYTGGIEFMRRDIRGMSSDVALLGISLYVLGFGTGCVCIYLCYARARSSGLRSGRPLLWASLSEVRCFL
jgi:hypothetical protein